MRIIRDYERNLLLSTQTAEVSLIKRGNNWKKISYFCAIMDTRGFGLQRTDLCFCLEPACQQRGMPISQHIKYAKKVNELCFREKREEAAL